jgi:hypothetical protein
MWAREARIRAAKTVARVVADYASSDRLMHALSRLQHARTVLDEAQGAFWHLTALPSRRDVRLMARRVASLRRRVAELDHALARLEITVQERESKGNGVIPRA